MEAYEYDDGSPDTTTPAQNDPNCGYGGSGWKEDPMTGGLKTNFK